MSRIARTKSEIAEEIDGLRALMPRVQRYSLFGDDNHAKMDAEIETLEELREEEEIFTYFEDELGVAIDDESELRDAALRASQWLYGDTEEKPSDGWRGIAR